MRYDIIVLGGGPAGITAATQLSRSGLSVLVLERQRVGYRLAQARRLDNLPLLAPTSGGIVAATLAEQAQRLGFEVRRLEATGARWQAMQREFVVETAQGPLLARRLVLAVGLEPRRLPELEVSERVAYYPTELDALGVRQLAIAGSGEAALDGALRFAERGAAVTVYAKALSPTIVRALRVEAEAHPAIELCEGAPVQAVEATAGGLRVRSQQGLRPHDALLIAVGRALAPRWEQLRLDAPRERLYVCGDAARGRLGQCALALGDGMSAALSIVRDWGSP